MGRVQLTAVAATILARVVLANENPCFDRSWEVPNCTPVHIPQLCAYCPLEVDNVEDVGEMSGHFKDCTQLFYMDSTECQWAMLEYIKKTPCDDITNKAYYDYYHGKAETCKPDDRSNSCTFDGIARAVLERLVYTNCELCCDCIGCGTLSDYEPGTQLLPLIETRKNCPLHAYYDNCQHFPDQEYAHPDTGASIKICDHVNDWFTDGQSEPGANPVNDAIIYPILKEITENHWGCNLPGVWLPCKEMENRQGRLTPGHENC